MPGALDMQGARGRGDGAGMAAAGGTSQQGKCGILAWRIELGVGNGNSTGQITERRMIGIVYDRIVDDLPKEAEIWRRRFGETDLVNPHVEEGHDQQWLIGCVLTGNKGLPFEDVMSVDGKFGSDTHDGPRGQRRYLRRWPYQTKISDGAFREQLEPVSVPCRIGHCWPAAEQGASAQRSESFQESSTVRSSYSC